MVTDRSSVVRRARQLCKPRRPSRSKNSPSLLSLARARARARSAHLVSLTVSLLTFLQPRALPALSGSASVLRGARGTPFLKRISEGGRWTVRWRGGAPTHGRAMGTGAQRCAELGSGADGAEGGHHLWSSFGSSRFPESQPLLEISASPLLTPSSLLLGAGGLPSSPSQLSSSL